MMERPGSFEELLSSRGYILYTCVGSSMMPLLRPRKDIVVISPRGNERCRKYDVVLYQRGEKYVIHRILRVKPDGYDIAGDHNTYLERNITDDQILGVMTRLQRDGREMPINGLGYKTYVFFWCGLYPIRMFALRVKNGFSKAGCFIMKRIGDHGSSS